MSCDETEKRFSLDYYTKHPVMCKRFYFLFILMRLWELILCFVCLLLLWQKKSSGVEDSFKLPCQNTIMLGSQGRNSSMTGIWKQAESELMGKFCLLEWSSSLNQLPALWGIPPIVNWATPPHTVIKTKQTETCLNVNLIKSFFTVYFIFPKWGF